MLNVYDFYTVELLIFLIFQFVVFYELNILAIYLSAKKLRLKPETLNLINFFDRWILFCLP